MPTFFYTCLFPSCTACPIGSLNSQPGLTFCTACATGQYQVSAGHPCSDCPQGEAETSRCSTRVRFDTGTYTASTGQVQCSSCPPGSYGTGTGQSACQNCEA